MGSSVAKTLRECKGDVCECLWERIEQLAFAATKEAGGGTQGLQQRFAQQVAKGAQGPGTQSWANHEKAIKDQQEALKDHLEKSNEEGCTNGPGMRLNGAYRLAYRENMPTQAEWEANNPSISSDTGLSTGQVVAGAAIGAGAFYVGWRVIRMVPSLFPPLWWTIPGNAAIP